MQPRLEIRSLKRRLRLNDAVGGREAVLIRQDGWPFWKGDARSRRRAGTEGQPREEAVRGWPPASRGEASTGTFPHRAPRTPTLPAPRSWTSKLQNCEKSNHWHFFLASVYSSSEQGRTSIRNCQPQRHRWSRESMIIKKDIPLKRMFNYRQK